MNRNSWTHERPRKLKIMSLMLALTLTLTLMTGPLVAQASASGFQMHKHMDGGTTFGDWVDGHAIGVGRPIPDTASRVASGTPPSGWAMNLVYIDDGSGNRVTPMAYCLNAVIGFNLADDDYTPIFSDRFDEATWQRIIWLAMNGFQPSGGAAASPTATLDAMHSSSAFANNTTNWPSGSNIAAMRAISPGITELEAFMATQMAIWTFANSTLLSQEAAALSGGAANFNNPLLFALPANARPHDDGDLGEARRDRILPLYNNLLNRAMNPGNTGNIAVHPIEIQFNAAGATLRSGGIFGPIVVNLVDTANALAGSANLDAVDIEVTPLGGYTLRATATGADVGGLSLRNGNTFFVNIGTMLPQGTINLAEAEFGPESLMTNSGRPISFEWEGLGGITGSQHLIAIAATQFEHTYSNMATLSHAFGGPNGGNGNGGRNGNGNGGDVDITGNKTWNHGSNDPANHPRSITVLVMANGVEVRRQTITAAHNWSWFFVMPRYDRNGREINYTIDELDVPGYDKRIVGHSIVNTHRGHEPFNPRTGRGG